MIHPGPWHVSDSERTAAATALNVLAPVVRPRTDTGGLTPCGECPQCLMAKAMEILRAVTVLADNRVSGIRFDERAAYETTMEFLEREEW